jgi:hypothetical protein
MAEDERTHGRETSWSVRVDMDSLTVSEVASCASIVTEANASATRLDLRDAAISIRR